MHINWINASLFAAIIALAGAYLSHKRYVSRHSRTPQSPSHHIEQSAIMQASVNPPNVDEFVSCGEIDDAAPIIKSIHRTHIESDPRGEDTPFNRIDVARLILAREYFSPARCHRQDERATGH